MKLQESKRTLLCAAAAALAFWAPPAAHADTYPNRPVTIIVPYGPGGNADLSARALAAALGNDKLLSQPVVVENRDGAGGIIGTQYVINAPKDGYTLLLARIGSQVVAPALDPNTPYKWDDLTPIGLLEIDPYVCVVKRDSPYKSFKELLAAVKADPGKLSYATTGNMDASVVFPMKAFLEMGLPATAAIKVPYKSASAIVAPILNGTVDFTCNALAPFVGGIQAGTLRPLVVSTPNRLPEMPDVPTVAEVGMKELEMVSGWSALYGPPGLPKKIVKQWEDILAKAKGSPFWLSQAKRRGTVANVMTAAQTHDFAREQYQGYHALAKHIRPNP
jgi:tripartite-type tricarboxylate transporter receptor subunit TctC